MTISWYLNILSYFSNPYAFNRWTTEEFHPQVKRDDGEHAAPPSFEGPDPTRDIFFSAFFALQEGQITSES